MSGKQVEEQETLRDGQLTSGEDWRQWDPDALFQKLTVSEVKRTHNKLKLDVDGKQEELRLMVGERYRDLLEASKAILSMNQASLRVLAVLQEVRETCSRGASPSVTAEPRSQQLDSTLQSFQGLAAHLKLLLDAPEHIWRLLERRAFLEAAWLFLLCRLVHRALVSNETRVVLESEGEDLEVLENFPLIQRQWDIISHLSSQISHRAKIFLKEGVVAQEVTSALVALHLLDHHPLLELLNIYLSQRSKGLRDILAKPLLSPSRPDSQGGEGSPTVPVPTFTHIADRLALLRDSTFQTLRAVNTTFGQGPETAGLMSRILTDIHSGERSEKMTPCTDDILASLPSSTHLLLLPASIKSYRPALDISAVKLSISGQRESTASTWAANSFRSIKTEVGSLFGQTSTVSELWRLHDLVLVQSGAPLDTNGTIAWKDMVEESTHIHTAVLWNLRLTELLDTFTSKVEESMTVLTNHTESTDTSSFLFSNLATNELFSGRTHSSGSQALKRTLRQRLDMRQPQLRDVLAPVEMCAKALEADLGSINQHSVETLRVKYAYDAFRTMSLAVDVVHRCSRANVDSLSVGNMNPMLFAGNIALELLERSELLETIRCTKSDIEVLKQRLLSIREGVLDNWRKAMILHLSEKLKSSLSLDTDASQRNVSPPPAYPSSGVVKICKEIVGQARKLGFRVGSDGFIAVVQKTFLALLSEGIPSLKISPAPWTPETAQVVLDVSFLKVLAQNCKALDSSAEQRVSEQLIGYTKQITGESGEAQSYLLKLDSSLESMLSSLRLVLLPMLANASHSIAEPRGPKGTLKAEPLADPAVSEIVHLVKPTPRIGLVQL